MARNIRSDIFVHQKCKHFFSEDQGSPYIVYIVEHIPSSACTTLTLWTVYLKSIPNDIHRQGCYHLRVKVIL